MITTSMKKLLIQSIGKLDGDGGYACSERNALILELDLRSRIVELSRDLFSTDPIGN